MIENSLYKLDLFNNGPVVIFIWKNESGWPVESITNNILDIYGHDSKQYLSGELKYVDQIHPDDLSRVFKEVATASNNPKSNSFIHQPYRYLDGSGKYRWVKDSSQIIRSENGNITHFIGYLVDVTSEIELQEETNRLKERLDLAWTGTGDGLWDWDIEHNIVYFSPRWKEMIGYHPDEFPNEVSAFFQAIHPGDQLLVEDLLNRHFSNPENIPYEIDARICCKNGEYKWIKIRGKAFLSAEGTPLRMTGSHTDISKEVELRQEIKNQKQLYQNLMEFASDGIFIMNLDGEIIQCSKHAADVLGYSMDEMKSLHVYDWDAELTKDEALKYVRNTPTQPFSFETKHRRKDGSIYDAAIVSVKITTMGNDYIYASVRNITESVRLKAEIIKERNFVSAIINNTNAIIAVINTDDTMIRLSKYGEDFTGYTQNEVASEPYFWSRFLNKDIQDKFIDIIANSNTSEKIKNFQNTWTSRSGETRIFEWSSTLLSNVNGELDYLVTTGIDITQLQNAKNTVEEKEQLLETLLNSITEGVYGFDVSGKCIFVNQTFLQLLGYDHENEILGKNIHRLIHHTRKDGSEYPDDQCMIYKANRIHEACHANDETFWKRDGTSIEVECWSRPIHNERYNGSVVTFLDITTKNRLKREREQQDEQMLQQSRLAQMGEMISMIAHQWRQPLMAISIAAINMKLDAQLECFDLKTKDGRDAQKNAYLDELNNIENYIENLTTTIDDFRNFYKPDKRLTLCSFHEISSKALNIIQKSLDMACITMVEEYCDEVKLEMHENEVMQVILNIFKNAQDNFKEKKILNPQIKITSKDNTLYISDNGGGIPDNIIDKIFDPYFSTKDEKNGTGLGLYMSKMIIEEHHNGSLKAENLNGGVLFKLIINSDLNLSRI